MTTSGLTTFNLDLNDMVEEAFERAGSELRTGYDLRTARRSLNLLFADWANRGVNMWTFEQNTITLVQGQPTYALPDDTVDLLDHVIRTNANVPTNQADLTITRISMPTYATIPNKLIQGRPIQVWVNRQSGAKYPVGGQPEGTDPATGIDYPQITIWPTPNDPGSQYTFVYWRLRRIQDAGQGGVTTQDIPFRFIPCLVAGMSYYLSMKYPDTMARTAELKLAYEEQWKYASEEDRDKSAIRFVPRRMFIA